TTPHPITGLTPGTTYKAQIFAIINGNEVASEAVAFTTPSTSAGDDTILAVNYNVTVTDITATSAVVSQRCDLPSGVLNGIVTYIGIFLYDGDSNEVSTIYSEDPAFLPGDLNYFNNNNIPISELEPDTTYSVRVSCIIGGKTYNSDFVEFTTSALSADVDYFDLSKEEVGEYLVLVNGAATLYSTPNADGPVATMTVNGDNISSIPRYYFVYADYVGSNRNGEIFYHLSNAVGFVCDQIEGTYIKGELAEELQAGKYAICPFSKSSTTVLIRSQPDNSSSVIASWSRGTSLRFTGEIVYEHNSNKDLPGAKGRVISGSTEGWVNVGYLVYDSSHVHTFGELTNEVQPSCLTSGYAVYTCTDCGYSETVDIPAIGHDEGTWVHRVNPSCTGQGLDELVCGRCGSTLNTGSQDALGHSFGEWVETTAPTCTEFGEETRYCSRCDATETREIEALRHSFVTIPGKAATCTETGLTDGEACSRCGYVKTEQTVVPVIDHNYVYGVCSVCGAIDPNYDPSDPTAPRAIVDNAVARSGKDVSVSVTLENTPDIKAIAASDVTFDPAILSLLGAEWSVDGAVLSDWNAEAGKGVVTMAKAADLNGTTIITLSFRVSDDAADGVYTVKLIVSAKDSAGEDVTVYTDEGSVTVRNIMVGDLNGDDKVTDEDAVHLLYHVFFPDDFTLNQDGDFNKDGKVTDEDAIYLLYYVFFPDEFPID
ncbi:MAG: hypothetical protein IKN38_09135, partial [Clostridia bacterium]|nr:hypothetical protein [Clostridia bacterium]